jgi:uncharacterized membrane protein
MAGRPKINLQPSRTGKVLDILGWLALFMLWELTVSHYGRLPDIIPTHFNLAGHADRSGGKATILVLPVLATVLFVTMTVLNRFPWIFNYPVKITPENARVQYANATRMVRWLKLEIVIVFGLIFFKTIQTATDHSSFTGISISAIALCLIGVTLAYYLVRSIRNR